MNSKLKKEIHHTDLCVIGGGLAGMCAAIAAARGGAKVVLVHDRPVLGGNASSEIRMWVRGAHGENNRETGILEEIELENMYRNPMLNFSVWDSVLYRMVAQEKNITLLLNCSCANADMNGAQVESVVAWQLTTYTWHIIRAKFFADCSGDSILAPLTGALHRVGREGRDEYNESIEPPQGDKKTMGMSCLLQARETDHKVHFVPPEWANQYPDDSSFPCREHDLQTNYWWIELGGENDSIHDTERLREELLKIAFGVWDHIKNHGDHGADNWDLEWVGFLPGKRESRRYTGDYVLTQNDVEAGGKFDDIVAYGGWSMDDHHPGGFHYPGKPTIFHPAPSPYGIPYRCLYSKNIDNLFFAGRNISVTHAALSSTRVMATCALIGQAVGTAAALCVRKEIFPRDVYYQQIHALQKRLMEDGCYLPGLTRDIPGLTKGCSVNLPAEDAAVLFNGKERPDGQSENCIVLPQNGTLEFVLSKSSFADNLRLVFDPDFVRSSIKDENIRRFAMRCNIYKEMEPVTVPETLVRAFTVEVTRNTGKLETIAVIHDNRRHVMIIPVQKEIRSLRVIFHETWGSVDIRLFACDIQ